MQTPPRLAAFLALAALAILPAALAQKLLQHDIANLVRRVQQGQPLTPAERSMLQDMAAAPAAGAKAPAPAKK